ncbi:TTK protein kinase [Mycena sanguinolenta]|uniref:TTK protein kinase n=1 Tax=Mycena sanguinolenta TaxID=230812 RepID=A0A8H6WNY3_9AGAR|nr:TTK protein kinase [Mycena sanguinolenta]
MATVHSPSPSATTTPAPSPPPAAPSPASDDSEVIDDLSFDYIFDEKGEYVRTTKGPSKNTRESFSPTTSEDRSFQPDFKPPSPLPALSLTNGPVKRSSLSRREGNQDPRLLAPNRVPVIDEHLQEEKENLGSGGRPLSFPLPSDHQDEFPYMAASTPGPPSSKPQGPGRLVMPVRSRVDAYSASTGRAQSGIQRSLSQTQRSSQRLVAPRSASAVSFGKIESIVPDGEDTDADDDMVHYEPPLDNPPRSRTPGSLNQSGNSRPRRSASLSDALANEDDYAYYQSSNLQSNSRPTTSLGFSTDGTTNDGPRRVIVDGNVDALVINKKYRREVDDAERRAQLQAQTHADELHHDHLQKRHSPSPPPSYSARPGYAHKRRDSDTLRSVPHPPLSGLSGSPSAPHPPAARLSPSARGLQAPSVSASTVTGVGSAKHRRSGTAPEQQTTSGMLAPTGPNNQLGRTWNGERESAEWESERREQREPVRERVRPQLQPVQQQQQVHHHQQQQQQQQQLLQQQQQQLQQSQAAATRTFVVNRKVYARLDMIGKGGTSRVFRVLNGANELYAIKRVSLDKTDAETMSGYMNEIALLKRLDGNSRIIIRLIDSEVKAGPGGSKGHLFLVMECGEIDLARLISEQLKEPLNMVWVAYYWQQMLQAGAYHP